MRKILRHVKQKNIPTGKLLKIGVVGAGRGVGTTHLCIMIANFCANFKGLKTALVECNDNKDYIRIWNEVGNTKTDMYDFLYQTIRFISGATAKKISQLESEKYHIIVFDCSRDDELGFLEFLRCNIRIVVCSTQLYKIGCTKKMLSDVTNLPVEAVAFCADKKAKVKIEKEFKRGLDDIPVEYNALCIKQETCNWINQLLKLTN